MKKLHNAHWAINKDTEGLLFFAQRLNEMLFDFTIDTYKASALNTLLLCIEARQTIDYIENGSIDEKHLEGILEELNWAYSSDLVVKNILGRKISLYLPIRNSSDREDLKIKLEILINKLSPLDKYIETLNKLLSTAVKNNRKKEINFLVGNLITSLTSFAYHQNYIYQKTHNFFFHNRNSINSKDQIDEFLAQFNFSEKEFDVIFIASVIFKEIKETCEKFNVKINDVLDTKITTATKWRQLSRQFRKKDRTDQFITVQKEEAFDKFSARKDAGQKLRKIANLFTYFHHKKRPMWQEKALVIENKSNEIFLISNPTSPMEKGFDLKPKKAANKLNKFISNFGLKDKSFVLFNRANDLHGLAVADSSIENQMLNIWIALETIIQSNKNRSKIEHITNSLLPSLTINYVEKLVKDVADSLARWNRNKYRMVLKKIPDSVAGTVLLKTAALISCEEYKDLREEIYKELDDFPLLKFRIYQLYQQLNSAEKVLNLIETHRKKVSWHIRRIYRTRNLIVHEGKISNNMEILVENAHTYLDMFLNTLIDLAENGSVRTIEQGIKETTLLYQNYEKQLKEKKNEKCSKDNFQSILFH